MLLAVAVLLMFIVPVAGQADQPVKPLTGRLQLSAQQMRSNAPFFATVALTSNRPTLIQGEVEISVYEERERLLQYRSYRVALMRGEQTFRFLLPPVSPQGLMYGMWAQLRFHELREDGEYATHDLGATVLTEIGASRIFQVAVCDGNSESLGMTSRGRTVGQNLRLDRFAPREEGMRSPVHTAIVHLPAADVPVSPLALTAYDVVVLVGDAIGQLTERQLDALQAWVMAGGSICIVAPASVGPAQLAFLNALAEMPASSPFDSARTTFSLDVDGQVMALYEDGTDRAWSLHFAGLGRAMILLDRSAIIEVSGTDQSEQAQAWRRAVGFLWKLRESQIERIARGKTWQLNDLGWQDGTAAYEYGVQPLYEVNQILPAVLPDNVRIVPFLMIVLCLIGLTVLIGPVDYFMLGMLRRRKFTWVTYPTMTIAFTVLVVQLTNGFMGSQNHRGHVRIVDVGYGGRVLRQTWLETVMMSATGMVELDLEDVIVTPVSLNNRILFDEEDTGVTSVYIGRLFSAYRHIGHARKWEPQINRHFTISTGRTTIESLNLEDVDPAQWHRSDARITLRGRLLDSDPTLKDAYIVLSHGKDDYVLSGRDPIAAAYYRMDVSGWNDEAIWDPEPGWSYRDVGFVRMISRLPAVNLFSVISQLAPTGGSALEDLSILNTGDSSTWLLVIVQPEQDGNGFVVYRRVFRE